MLRNSLGWVLIIDSESLAQTDSLEIGPQLFKTVGSPPLNRGRTEADFHISGISFMPRMRLK